MDPEICSVTIIKFAIQPLVENAIYHGLKYKDTKEEEILSKIDNLITLLGEGKNE